MTKHEELSNPNSCLNRAADDEPLFILLGRDVATPETIRYWARSRVNGKKKNTWEDEQIREALQLAWDLENKQPRAVVGPLEIWTDARGNIILQHADDTEANYASVAGVAPLKLTASEADKLSGSLMLIARDVVQLCPKKPEEPTDEPVAAAKE